MKEQEMQLSFCLTYVCHRAQGDFLDRRKSQVREAGGGDGIPLANLTNAKCMQFFFLFQHIQIIITGNFKLIY